MLSLFYLIVATIKEDFAIAPMFMVIADALNTLLFLVGGIALAAYLGVHSCDNQVGFMVPNMSSHAEVGGIAVY